MVDMSERMEAMCKMDSHIANQKSQHQQLISSAKSFQSQLSSIADGKWTESAIQCIKHS